MKFPNTKWGLVLVCVWLAILITAAIALPTTNSRPLSAGTVTILALSVGWLLLTVVALVLYFYRASRRLGAAQNKFSYSVWLLFEMACAIVLAGVVAWLLAPKYVTSPRRERERILRDDLFTMRTIIDQYTLDKQESPHSLEDLVLSGYLKNVPTDPMTRRNDTWVVKCSADKSEPGIVDIESGYGAATIPPPRCD